MAASKLKLLIDQGATFRKKLTWKAGSPAVPVDLTGCTARMQIRAEISADVPLATLTTENGGITLGGVSGTVELFMDDAKTSAFSWTEAVYDLEVVLANGDVRRLLFGAVVVSPEVTRG